MKHSIFLLLALTAVTFIACSPAESATSPVEPVELSLIATDIAYDVNRLEVAAGQPVKLTLQNQGVLEHDFSITEMPYAGDVTTTEMAEEMPGHDMSNIAEEPDIHVAAPTDGSNTIEFTPSTPGEYEFYCTVAGHKEAGMVGTLVVKES